MFATSGSPLSFLTSSVYVLELVRTEGGQRKLQPTARGETTEHDDHELPASDGRNLVGIVVDLLANLAVDFVLCQTIYQNASSLWEGALYWIIG